MAERKKFTRSKPLGWIEFDVDDDTLLATTVVPGMVLLDVSAVNKAEDMEKLRIIMEFLDHVLHPDSAQLLTDRLRDPKNPLDLEELTSVAIWLVQEVYVTERPTQEASPSQNGSSNWAEFDGRCLDAGFDPRTVDAARCLNYGYYLMVKNLKPEDRRALDDVLLAEVAEPDQETGLKPPAFWRGEEDAAASAEAFMGATRRRRG